MQLLPSSFPICTSTVRGYGARDCPDSGGDQADLGEEATVSKQMTYCGDAIRRSRLRGRVDKERRKYGNSAAETFKGQKYFRAYPQIIQISWREVQTANGLDLRLRCGVVP